MEHLPRELRTKPAGGGDRKRFVDDVATHRDLLSRQWQEASGVALERAGKAKLSRAVIKVKLHRDALAKSHRPHYLLEQAGRNKVIGGTSIGTLLVSVSERSAKATLESISQNDTKNGIADVTTIERIDPFSPSDVLTIAFDDRLYGGGALARLFNFGDAVADAEARKAIYEWARERKAGVVEIGTGTYSVKPRRAADLVSLSELGAVRELSPNEIVSAPQLDGPQTSTPFRIAPPVKGHRYATVGLLDSGCFPVAALTPWIAKQSNPIALSPAPAQEDFRHGTFIGGLLVLLCY